MTDDLKDALLVDDDEPGMSDEDTAVYDLLDKDPDVRAAVAQEIKTRLMQSQQRQAPAPEQPLPVASELSRVAQAIEDTEAWLDAFYQKPDTERDYVEYQRKQDDVRRLQRQESQLTAEYQRQSSNLSQTAAWVDEWVQERKAQEKAQHGASLVDRYAGAIKQMATQLDPKVRADKNQLRNALAYYLEPNAYKQYNEARRGRDRANIRRDSGSYSEPGDEGAPVRDTKDKYADATPEEREFLRGVGLLKPAAKESRNELVPLPSGDGFVIPIGRGRLNARRDDA